MQSLHRRILLLFLLVLFCTGYFVHGAYSNDQQEVFALGETEVVIHVSENGNGYTYLALHENESTSVAAAKKVIATHGGRLVILKHGGGRNVTFLLNGQRYAFDPNRIFSDVGIKETLQNIGGTYSKEAHIVVARFATRVLMLSVHSKFSKMIVTLHNNREGGYSIESYKEGGSEAHSTGKLFIGTIDPDDFFLVTRQNMFTKLKTGGFNVVLQASAAKDDGSLSVYASRYGIAYVNPEAQNGHLAEQVRMLEFLH